MHLAVDQASSLRATLAVRSARPQPARTPLVVIASGKGGVGKTFLAVNLALALRGLGARPVLADLDWGLANVDVALGLAPRRHLGHVLSGEASLPEVLLEHSGVKILPNGCGDNLLAAADREWQAAIIRSLQAEAATGDVIIADTHPGLGAVSRDLMRMADLVLIVTTPEPTSLTDTYALYKVLAEAPPTAPIGLVVNQASGQEQGARTAQHLSRVAAQFLDIAVDHWGTLPTDPAVSRSIHRQRPLLETAPGSPAAAAIRALGKCVFAASRPARRAA